jgi:hypothetical protein
MLGSAGEQGIVDSAKIMTNVVMTWWHMLVFQTFRGLRLKNLEFEDSLKTMRSCLRKR